MSFRDIIKLGMIGGNFDCFGKIIQRRIFGPKSSSVRVMGSRKTSHNQEQLFAGCWIMEGTGNVAS